MKPYFIALALFTVFSAPALSKPRHRPPAPSAAFAGYWSQFALDYKWQVTLPTIAAARAWLPPAFVQDEWNRALWDEK